MDEEGNIRPGCRILPKGETYEMRYFSARKDEFKSSRFLSEVKQMYTDLINELAADVADRQEEVIKRVAASVEEHGEHPGLFAAVIRSAIAVLKEFLEILMKTDEKTPEEPAGGSVPSFSNAEKNGKGLRPDSTEAEIRFKKILPVHEKLRQCNRRLYAMQDRQETHQKALDTLPRTVFHYKERKELQADLEDLQKKMAKNNLIECCRILFTLIVCLHHAASLSDKPLMLKHGYLCVEFFFMLSGYLLHRSFRREERHSTLHYVGKRLRRLYPEYAFAAIIAILLYGVLRREFDLTQAVQELLMLQNTGLFRMGGYNYPCWYIAVMMVSGILIYGMLTVSRQTYVKVLAPLVILGGYTYLIGLRDGIEEWSYAGPVSQALLRGFCGMSVGVLISCFVCRKIKISRKLILLMEIVSVLLIAAGLFTDISSEMLTITAFGGLLLAISLDEAGQAKLAESRLIPAVSGYCYGMYLNHAVVITVMGLLKGRVSFSVLCIIFYAVLFMYTAVTRRVSRGAAKALESWFGSDS